MVAPIPPVMTMLRFVVGLFSRLSKRREAAGREGRYEYLDLRDGKPIPNSAAGPTYIWMRPSLTIQAPSELNWEGSHNSGPGTPDRHIGGIIEYGKQPMDADCCFRYKGGERIETGTHTVRFLSASELLFEGRRPDYGSYLLRRTGPLPKGFKRNRGAFDD